MELHDEKKKRTHRIFDDISPSKYTSTLTKSLSEEISEDLKTRPSIRSPSLSPFHEFSCQDNSERQSPEDDSKDDLFSLDDDSFPGDGISGPIFEGFTPAKNQETYSKKKKISKLIDDSPESPADNEQSSEDEPDGTVQKLESDNSQSAEKSPKVEIPQLSEDTDTKDLESQNETLMVEETEIEEFIKEREQTPPPAVIVEKIEEFKLVAIPSAITLPPIDSKIEEIKNLPEPKSPKIKLPSSPLLDTEEDKSEPDSPARLDVITDPPSFLLESEGPNIAEKLLKAISGAKSRSVSPRPIEEEPISPKKESSMPPEKPKIETIKPVNIADNLKEDLDDSTFDEPSDLNDEPEPKKLKSNPIDEEEESPPLVGSPLHILERPGAGKNNKVLSDTIQKLSSQINQSNNIPLATFPPEDRSESSDSDDSDRR